MAGQSNMEGRGFLSKMPSLSPKGRVKQWNAAQWVEGHEPVHPGSGGVGPGLAFATKLASLHPNVEMGLIPTAYGGSALEEWAPGLGPSSLYEQMLSKTVQACAAGGELKGLIWYQGESDATTFERASTYASRFQAWMDHTREDLNAPNLPIVFTVLCTNPNLDFFPYWDLLVSQQVGLNLDEYTRRVSAQGLQVRTDDPEQAVHLDTEGQMVLGPMMAVQMDTMMPA